MSTVSVQACFGDPIRPSYLFNVRNLAFSKTSEQVSQNARDIGKQPKFQCLVLLCGNL